MQAEDFVEAGRPVLASRGALLSGAGALAGFPGAFSGSP
jgi:hypothetical protein